MDVSQEFLDEIWLFFEFPEDYISMEDMMIFCKAAAAFQNNCNPKKIKSYEKDLPIAKWKHDSDIANTANSIASKLEDESVNDTKSDGRSTSYTTYSHEIPDTYNEEMLVQTSPIEMKKAKKQTFELASDKNSLGTPTSTAVKPGEFNLDAQNQLTQPKAAVTFNKTRFNAILNKTSQLKETNDKVMQDRATSHKNIINYLSNSNDVCKKCIAIVNSSVENMNKLIQQIDTNKSIDKKALQDCLTVFSSAQKLVIDIKKKITEQRTIAANLANNQPNLRTQISTGSKETTPFGTGRNLTPVANKDPFNNDEDDEDDDDAMFNTNSTKNNKQTTDSFKLNSNKPATNPAFDDNEEDDIFSPKQTVANTAPNKTQTNPPFENSDDDDDSMFLNQQPPLKQTPKSNNPFESGVSDTPIQTQPKSQIKVTPKAQPITVTSWPDDDGNTFSKPR